MNSLEKNTLVLKEYCDQLAIEYQYKIVVGTARFDSVYSELMPVQQKKVSAICGEKINVLMKSGYFISVGVVYPNGVIDGINRSSDTQLDLMSWNSYASYYKEINSILDAITSKIAVRFNGISIKATLSGLSSSIEHVAEYFPQTVSHRAIAEKAGLGWRGKNSLIIHKKYSCALRFASVITETQFIPDKVQENQCDHCTACEDACSFIRNRNVVKDYRENCRRYITHLQQIGLNEEVCGKCIKACLKESIHKNQFDLG